MENLIKKIDEKLVELEAVKERLISLGVEVPIQLSDEEEEYFELLDNMVLLGYTEDEIVEFETSDEELEMGAPMGNQNAAGPHGSGGAHNIKGVRRAQYKKDMGNAKYHMRSNLADKKTNVGDKLSVKKWEEKRKGFKGAKKYTSTMKAKKKKDDAYQMDRKMDAFTKQISGKGKKGDMYPKGGFK
jgi:hypothetical protein